MHNFVYLAQRRSQEFSCEPNLGGGRACPRFPPHGCATGPTSCPGGKLSPRYRRKNGIGVMVHELTLNELAVESQYLLKLQSDKIIKIPGSLTSIIPL